jgi:hypothetical protein
MDGADLWQQAIQWGRKLKLLFLCPHDRTLHFYLYQDEELSEILPENGDTWKLTLPLLHQLKYVSLLIRSIEFLASLYRMAVFLLH